MNFEDISRYSLRALMIASVCAVSTSALADDDDHDDDHDHEEEHFDIGVWNNNGVLQTGGWDHDTESLEVDYLRVFEATFGEDPMFPFSTDEPGVGGNSELGLALGGTFSLNVASGLGAWNGNGFSPTTSPFMTVEYGTTTVDTLSGGALDFLVTEDYDNHPIYSIDESADPGAYLMELTAKMDGLEDSDTFWIVFNLGLDEEEYEASVEWVEDNLVPTPAALPALGLAFIAGRRRRS